MSRNHLAATVDAFNLRRYQEAVRHSAEGLAVAQGRDEAFWMGLNDACEGFALIEEQKWAPAEQKLVSAMQTLRNFGFRYNNFEITAALAGIRKAVEEIKFVCSQEKRVFDVTLLPHFRLGDPRESLMAERAS
ncbi:hypothetical protein CSB20_11920 [bacterium DOLZORAL124_64_63]|nr:MAG: hypothetical protein CSB20_11920 [bacterium DOLZORAL124_64_63]